MPTYHAPVEDGLFLLRDVLRVQDHAHLPGFEELSPQFCGEVLTAAARFHEEVLHPLNKAGDDECAHLEKGRVRTPAGFRDAWDRYRAAGWSRLSVPASLGGAGLPAVISSLVGEMRTATAHSFSMYGAFCGSTARMLSVLGAPWMKEHVVPRLVEGDWTATMCMTEAHAGSDLRQLRTRAVQQPDGSWRITGSKIFISGGDHDLTDNILHVVLAKVPDENGRLAEGLSSVNAFVVSARHINQVTGELGERNGVSVASIEHKMGIGGSATCVMNFEDAVGWRLADSGREGTSSNMAGMFMLMNTARVGTAMSGVAYSEIARQNAADYARQRLSGRAPGRARAPGQPADPIVAHPDVRRLLLGARSFAEGARATAVRVAFLQSVADGDSDSARRQRARDVVDLLVPVMKAYFTDKGFDGANDALQVLGGHGYVREYGLEHFVRNARIGQIYEGANGIQAIDLVQRKLTAGAGRAWVSFKDLVIGAIESLGALLEWRAQAKELAAALSRLDDVVTELRSASPEVAAAGAYDFLTALGITTVAWNWAEIVLTLQRPDVRESVGDAVVQRKHALAQLWFARELPLVHALAARALSTSEPLLSVPDEMV
jgi:alkylation response protein AidB-like acyl-CoA dehydrogenase